MVGDHRRQFRHRDDVLEEPAAIGVMDGLRRWVFLESSAVDGQGLAGELIQVWALDGLEERFEPAPQILRIFRRRRNQESLVETVLAVAVCGPPALVDAELDLVAIALDRAPIGDEVVGLEIGVESGAVGPNLRDDGARSSSRLWVSASRASMYR